MFKTSNINLVAVLMVNDGARVEEVIPNGNGRKMFVMDAEETDLKDTIKAFFGGEKILISPLELFTAIKGLKGMLYDS